MTLNELKVRAKDNKVTDDAMIKRLILSVAELPVQKLYTTPLREQLTEMPYGDYCIERICDRLSLEREELGTTSEFGSRLERMLEYRRGEYMPMGFMRDMYLDVSLFLSRIFMK